MYGRGEDVVRLRFRSVSRDTLGFGCVCVHICSHHHTFVQARALALTYLQSGVECPNFFIFASLSLNTVVCVGVRVDVFLFLCVKFQKHSCTFKKDKTLGLGFKVTRGLARFRRRRRRALDDDDATWHHHHHHHLASSSSSSFARTEQTVEAWRSIDR